MSNWPKTTAGFPSKKKCSHCGSGPYKQGDTIYKINEEYWCDNPKCPKAVMQEEPKYISNNMTAVPAERIAYHDHAWELALSKAKHVYKDDKNVLQRDIMILAQVFYKGLMGVSS